jgi:hypothetical protein
MLRLRALVIVFSLLLAAPAGATDYTATRQAIESFRTQQVSVDPWLEAEVLERIELLFSHWMGTSWGLGAPQTQTPQEGKINCGTFVGTVLLHAGFNLNHRRLQRQPSELIVKTLAPNEAIRRFRYASMDTFLAGVREQGAGLYVIGLDNHVGFLVVEPEGHIRFVHADYVSETVVDQPAAEAWPIIESKYRIVGKILQPALLEAWMNGTKIAVLGNW